MTSVTHEQAHEVGMVAARLIQPNVMDDLTEKEAAGVVAEAYREAYAAVYGWSPTLERGSAEGKTQGVWLSHDELQGSQFVHYEDYNQHSKQYLIPWGMLTYDQKMSHREKP